MLSGGRAIAPALFACADGVCKADVTALLQQAGVAEVAQVRAAWIDGRRVQRVRTPLLRWARSIDPSDKENAINHAGFVYDPKSWSPSWSLQPNATRCGRARGGHPNEKKKKERRLACGPPVPHPALPHHPPFSFSKGLAHCGLSPVGDRYAQRGGDLCRQRHRLCQRANVQKVRL